MKRCRLLMIGWCVACLSGAGERTQLPVLINNVDPDYRGLTAGYVVDVAEVKIVVDAKGTPFALDSSIGLPDNVVEALSQWRYQPYKKDGHNVPCSITIGLPFRRAITPFIERHIRPAWSPKDERVLEAIDKGEQLTAEQAAQLERDLPRAEALEHRRTSLLVYYAKGLPDASKARSARAQLITWLIENYPEDEILGSPAAVINASGEPLADAEAQAQVKRLWAAACEKTANNTDIAEHALNCFRASDPGRALHLLLDLKDWAPRNAWIGNVDGLSALRVSALDPVHGRAVAMDDSAPRVQLAQRVQAALLKSDDAKVVLSAMATVESAHASLAKAQLWTAEQQEFCQRLLDHTKQTYPATSASCDLSAETSKLDALPVSPRKAFDKTPAIRKKVEPHYPAAAKSDHIQGTVKFSAVVNETGRIEQLDLRSGPLALYGATKQAVPQWEFRPALSKGRPIAVATNIEVNFSLGY